MCVPDEYSGKGVCTSGHWWDNKKEKVFYLIGRKIGFLFFCFVLSMTRDSQAFTQFPDFLAQGG